MGFFKRKKLSALDGLVATTANSICAVYATANEDSAIHYSAIVLTLGHDYVFRLGIDALDPDEFIKDVWQVASAGRSELITNFIPFTVMSTHALKIWGEWGDPEKVYYQRHFCVFVEGVPFEEFQQFYFNLAASFAAIIEDERWNWTYGR